jgi:8-oxo-dGTP pyrophosphatase MutT (NUDIX family)
MKFKQFAALPYRMRDHDVEILLITTRKKRRWSVPKGWPIKHNSPQQTAATEAYEEAGVHGPIGNRRIGQFRKRRLKKDKSCHVRRPNLSAGSYASAGQLAGKA